MHVDLWVSVPVRAKVTELGEGRKDVEAFLPDGTPIYVESFGEEGPGVFRIINELLEDGHD